MLDTDRATEHLRLTDEEIEANRRELELQVVAGQWSISRKGVLIEIFEEQRDAFDRYNQLKRRGKYAVEGEKDV